MINNQTELDMKCHVFFLFCLKESKTFSKVQRYLKTKRFAIFSDTWRNNSHPSLPFLLFKWI